MELTSDQIKQFIQLIHSRPTLWDTKHELYNDRPNRYQNWVDICDKLFPEWDELDSRSQEDKLKLLQKRWTNMKDSYRKDLRTNIRSNGRLKRCRYMYYQQLSFLYPVFRKLKINKTDENALGVKKITDISTLNSSTTNKTGQERSQSINTVVEHDQQNTLMQPIISAEELQFQQQQQKEEEADRMFLLSFLPDLGKITDDKKFLLKADMIMLFHRYTVTADNPMALNSSQSADQSSADVLTNESIQSPDMIVMKGEPLY